jgi:hypothetical protein
MANFFILISLRVLGFNARKPQAAGHAARSYRRAGTAPAAGNRPPPGIAGRDACLLYVY